MNENQYKHKADYIDCTDFCNLSMLKFTWIVLLWLKRLCDSFQFDKTKIDAVPLSLRLLPTYFRNYFQGPRKADWTRFSSWVVPENVCHAIVPESIDTSSRISPLKKRTHSTQNNRPGSKHTYNSLIHGDWPSADKFQLRHFSATIFVYLPSII